jgi:transcription-repair coupling factor (superfamily II helicase)
VASSKPTNTDNGVTATLSASSDGSNDSYGAVDKDLSDLEDAAESSSPATDLPPPITVGTASGWSLPLTLGDYVVHKKYGVGKFTNVVEKFKKMSVEDRSYNAGVVSRAREDAKRDAVGLDLEKLDLKKPVTQLTLEITYSDAILHVPQHRSYRLSRYRSGAIPTKLSSMYTTRVWDKQRQIVGMKAEEVASDVISLYERRNRLKRRPYALRYESRCESRNESKNESKNESRNELDEPKNELDAPKNELANEMISVDEFSSKFIHTPTKDQVKCFKDIKEDMCYKTSPMDRLICGDVGYGKTEVALRSLYRCVVNNRQAVLLAPTSVLAAQHYKNVKERFEGTGVEIRLLRGGGWLGRMGRRLRKESLTGVLIWLLVSSFISSSFRFFAICSVDENYTCRDSKRGIMTIILVCIP